MKISVYTLTSELHDERSVELLTQEFLASLDINFDLKGNDYSDFGSQPLCLIYVRTGGTEGIFKKLLPSLLEKSQRPFYLLTSGQSNSLAASMEILSYLQQRNLRGEILHGSKDYVTGRIEALLRVEEARRQLQGARLGIIGKPSDWLISSDADYKAVRERLGIELVDIPMQELLDTIVSNDFGQTERRRIRGWLRRRCPSHAFHDDYPHVDGPLWLPSQSGSHQSRDGRTALRTLHDTPKYGRKL